MIVEKKNSLDTATASPYTSDEEALIRIHRRLVKARFGKFEVEYRDGLPKIGHVTEDVLFANL